MEIELISNLATQGPFAILVGILMIYITKLHKSYQEEIKGLQERHDQQMAELRKAIDGNTRALNDLHSVTTGLNQIVTAFLQEELVRDRMKR